MTSNSGRKAKMWSKRTQISYIVMNKNNKSIHFQNKIKKSFFFLFLSWWMMTMVMVMLMTPSSVLLLLFHRSQSLQFDGLWWWLVLMVLYFVKKKLLWKYSTHPVPIPSHSISQFHIHPPCTLSTYIYCYCCWWFWRSSVTISDGNSAYTFQFVYFIDRFTFNILFASAFVVKLVQTIPFHFFSSSKK